MADNIEENDITKDGADLNQNTADSDIGQDSSSDANIDLTAPASDVTDPAWLTLEDEQAELSEFEGSDLFEILQLDDDILANSMDIMETGVTAGLSKIVRSNPESIDILDAMDDLEALGIHEYGRLEASDEWGIKEYESWNSSLDFYADLNYKIGQNYNPENAELMENAAIHMESMILNNHGQITDSMFKNIAETDFGLIDINAYQSEYKGMADQYDALHEAYPALTTADTLMMMDGIKVNIGPVFDSAYGYDAMEDTFALDYTWDKAFTELNASLFETADNPLLNDQHEWISSDPWQIGTSFNQDLSYDAEGYKYENNFSYHAYLDNVSNYLPSTDYYASNAQIIEPQTVHYYLESEKADGTYYDTTYDNEVPVVTPPNTVIDNTENIIVNNMNIGGTGIAEVGINTILVGKELQNDVLKGNSGQDIILADGGDTVTGGAGADKFVIGGLSGGPVHLTDFQHGIDKILISSSGPNALNIDGVSAAGSYAETYTSGQVTNVDIGELITLDQLTNVNINTIDALFAAGSAPISDAADQFILVNNILYFDENAGTDYITINDGLGHESLDLSNSARFIEVASFDGTVTIDSSDIAIISDMSVSPPVDLS